MVNPPSPLTSKPASDPKALPSTPRPQGGLEPFPAAGKRPGGTRSRLEATAKAPLRHSAPRPESMFGPIPGSRQAARHWIRKAERRAAADRQSAESAPAAGHSAAFRVTTAPGGRCTRLHRASETSSQRLRSERRESSTGDPADPGKCPGCLRSYVRPLGSPVPILPNTQSHRRSGLVASRCSFFLNVFRIEFHPEGCGGNSPAPTPRRVHGDRCCRRKPACGFRAVVAAFQRIGESDRF